MSHERRRAPRLRATMKTFLASGPYEAAHGTAFETSAPSGWVGKTRCHKPLPAQGSHAGRGYSPSSASSARACCSNIRSRSLLAL